MPTIPKILIEAKTVTPLSTPRLTNSGLVQNTPRRERRLRQIVSCEQRGCILRIREWNMDEDALQDEVSAEDEEHDAQDRNRPVNI